MRATLGRVGLVLLMGLMAMGSGWVARAAAPRYRPVPPPGSTTTSAPDAMTSTTATTLPLTVPGATSTTTSPSTSVTRVATTSPAPATTTTTIGPGNLPPELQALINGVRRTPPNNTSALLTALGPLVDRGLTPEQAALAGMGRFPVGGSANWADDWLYPRFDGTFHLHQGNDIFAAPNTPVRSPTDGTLRQALDPLGGVVLYITEPNGTYFYLAHLSGYAPGEALVQQVSTGQLVGFVGNTGDAAGGASHLHFEVHPFGGAAIDPKPYLDAWVSQAIAAVPQVVARLFPNGGRIHIAAVGGRLVLGGGPGAPIAPSRSELAWAAAASPAGGPLRLAAAQAETAARGIDWTAEVQEASAARLAWAQADQRAWALLAPLCSPELVLRAS